VPAALREVPWMIEELRVSQFAQGLGANGRGGPVSAKRIRRALAEAC
jgi:ATP-dependent helicase HrpA